MLLSLAPTDSPDWRAHYAWSENRGGPGLSVRRLRCGFRRPAQGKSFRIHVTADSRYRLWLNGRALGFGPVKGSLGRYFFDSYELGSLLRPGRNVLAAEVRHFGDNRPVASVSSPVPGFLAQGPESAGVDTPDAWRVWNDSAVTPDTTAYIDNAHMFLNHLDRVDLRLEPSGWRELSFDDSAWPRAVSTGPAADVQKPWGVASLRTLVPRDMPALTETPRRFVRTIEGREAVTHRFGERPRGWALAAGEGGRLLLDAGPYTTGFPEIDFEGGENREVRVTYVEAMGHWETVNGKVVWRKQPRRDDLETGEPHGYRDTLILRGGRVSWEPFYWRTFRYLLLEVMPGAASLRIRDARFRECVHPQRFSARFRSSDPTAERIFGISCHTLRVGAHDNYDDSPYYEQLSYIADTRLEALGSLHLAGEAGLPRRNLRLFLDTLRSDGLLDARVPCQYARQTIPYFCLHWILMLEDYWRSVGAKDVDFVREGLLAVDTILTFFRARVRGDGLVGPTGGWNMVDQVEGWPKGVPPAVATGGSTYLTCLLVDALHAAVRLHEQAGFSGDARRWRNLATATRRAVKKHWDSDAGTFPEAPDRPDDRRSQHAQAAAISAGILPAPQAHRLAQRLWQGDDLIRTHSMQSYYVARAMEKAGTYGDLHAYLLQEWRRQVGRGLTTWSEYPDPARSDSHAWAAWPAVDYVTKVLGIGPGEPGWASARLSPLVDGLEWAEGSAPSPSGVLTVSWKKQNAHLQFRATVPKGLRTVVELPGGFRREYPRGGRISVRVPLA